MTRRAWFLLVLIVLSCVPPLVAWQNMKTESDRAQSAHASLIRTRDAVTTIMNAVESRPVDASGSFGQADAVRLVNSALIEAGLTPSVASELALRDDPIRRLGKDAGRLQRLTIALRPIETRQLGRALRELESALPSFTPAEIGLQRPSGLNDFDTRYSVNLAFEREYTSVTEIPQP